MKKTNVKFPAGLAILAHRRKKGWVQQELAKKAGLSQSMVSKVERGYSVPTVIDWNKITKALGMPFNI